MHRPRSMTAVIRFRLAAFLLVGNWLLAGGTSALLAFSVLTENRETMLIGIVLAVLALTLIILQWIAANGTSCPLCRTPVLAPMRCMKHRKTRSLLGSHRLRVAAAILFKNAFRCPYCNEPTRLELRETISRSRVRKTQVN